MRSCLDIRNTEGLIRHEAYHNWLIAQGYHAVCNCYNAHLRYAFQSSFNPGQLSLVLGSAAHPGGRELCWYAIVRSRNQCLHHGVKTWIFEELPNNLSIHSWVVPKPVWAWMHITHTTRNNDWNFLAKKFPGKVSSCAGKQSKCVLRPAVSQRNKHYRSSTASKQLFIFGIE